MKRVTVLLVAGLVLAGFLILRRGQDPVKEEVRKDYNLVLISIDTIRADYLQIYNPAAAPVPHIQKIAQKGFIFTRAISQVPLTLPAHCSMLTGEYPVKHLVQSNTSTRLSDSAVTLAEVLQKEGYKTSAFIGAFVLSSGTGISQGFDTYDETFATSEMKKGQGLASLQRSADDVHASFLRWFDSKKPDQFFAFLHFYDPHLPYDPPSQFRPEKNTPEELYKGELRYVDSVIGKLYDELSARGVWENTVLLITGDHGEMFGEHEESGHGFFLYQPALQVPLILMVPGESGGRTIEEPVELVDLMPTVLDLLNVPVSSDMQGKSFKPALEGKERSSGYAVSECLTATQTFGAAPLRSIQDSRYKYIDSARPELYDLVHDPLEERNLYEQKKDLSAKMHAKLQSDINRYSAASDEVSQQRNLSAAELEQFAALGYIGGSASPPVNRSLDAKDMIGQWNDLSSLLTLVYRGRYKETFPLIQKMREAGPLPVAAEIAEAEARAGVGQYKEAVLTLETILKKDPANMQALSALAEIYQRDADPSKALSIYKRLWEELGAVAHLQTYASLMMRSGRESELRRSLDEWQKSEKLQDAHLDAVGEIYFYLRDAEKANLYLTQALQKNPQNEHTLTLLATLMDIRGETSKAIELMESRKQEASGNDFLHKLGTFYHRVGDTRKEIETFQQLVALYPADPKGYFYLGKALFDAGAPSQQVIRLAQKGLTLNPEPRYAVFGHDLLAEAYSKIGKQNEAEINFSQARRFESQLKQ